MLLIRRVALVGLTLLLAVTLLACAGEDTIGDVQWMVQFSAVQTAPSLLTSGDSSALQIQVAVDRITSGRREPAPDGTLVEFGSTGGRFESGAATQQAWTTGGGALAVLSVERPGSYDVTARVSDTEAILHVDLAENGAAAVR